MNKNNLHSSSHGLINFGECPTRGQVNCECVAKVFLDSRQLVDIICSPSHFHDISFWFANGVEWKIEPHKFIRKMVSYHPKRWRWWKFIRKCVQFLFILKTRVPWQFWCESYNLGTCRNGWELALYNNLVFL